MHEKLAKSLLMIVCGAGTHEGCVLFETWAEVCQFVLLYVALHMTKTMFTLVSTV